jgi:hypothetical protein
LKVNHLICTILFENKSSPADYCANVAGILYDIISDNKWHLLKLFRVVRRAFENCFEISLKLRGGQQDFLSFYPLGP